MVGEVARESREEEPSIGAQGGREIRAERRLRDSSGSSGTGIFEGTCVPELGASAGVDGSNVV